MADVGGHVEALGLLVDELRLHPGRRRTPQSQNAVAVMIVVERHERQLGGDEPRGCTVAQSLGGLRQRQADRAHAFERCLAGHAARLGFHPWPATVMRSSSTSPGTRYALR